MQGKVELSGVNTSQLPVLPQAQMENLLLLAKGGDLRSAGGWPVPGREAVGGWEV